MSTMQVWARRGPWPLAAQVAASVALSAVAITLAVLRADDLPLAIALLTMGAAPLVHAAARVAGSRRARQSLPAGRD